MEKPSKELIGALNSGVFKRFPFIHEHFLIEEGVQCLEKFFAEGFTDKVYLRLEDDYTGMFDRTYRQLAPLRESAYFFKEQFSAQKETERLELVYQKYNIAPMLLGFEKRDHLVLQLDFLYRLNRLMKRYTEECDERKMMDVLRDQIIFLDNHLLQWVPLLRARVLTYAQCDFYKGLLHILQGFLEVEREKLEGYLSVRYLENYY